MCGSVPLLVCVCVCAHVRARVCTFLRVLSVAATQSRRGRLRGAWPWSGGVYRAQPRLAQAVGEQRAAAQSSPKCNPTFQTSLCEGKRPVLSIKMEAVLATTREIGGWAEPPEPPRESGRGGGVCGWRSTPVVAGGAAVLKLCFRAVPLVSLARVRTRRLVTKHSPPNTLVSCQSYLL